MVDQVLSQAMKEVYASSPSDEIALDTLELRHPDFVDDLGAPTAIRVVQNFEDEQTWLDLDTPGVSAVLDLMSEDDRKGVGLVAKLEAGAPVDGGQMVAWVAMGFEFTRPPVDTNPAPEIEVTFDNVGQEIIKHLEAAANSQNKIEVTYREYLSTDISGPQNDPPLTMTLRVIDVNVFTIRGRARILDAGVKTFPGEAYTTKRFVSLGR